MTFDRFLMCPSAVAGCWRSRRYIKNQSKLYQKSLKNHSKIFQKSTKVQQKSTKNLLKSVLGPQEAARLPQDPPSPKTGRNIITPPGTILEGFWSHVGPKSHLKASQKTYKIFIDLKVHLTSIFHRFWPGFGRILDPSWPPKSIKNWIKMLTKF